MLTRGVRLVRRQKALAAVLTTLAVSLLAIVAGVTYGLVRADFERELRQATERERRIASAAAKRSLPLPGRRFGSLEDLAVAASLGPDLQIQNEAITTLTLPDLRVDRTCPADADLAFAVAPDFQSYAHADRQGNLFVRRMSDDGLVRKLPGGGAPVLASAVQPPRPLSRFAVCAATDKQRGRSQFLRLGSVRRDESTRSHGPSQWRGMGFRPGERQLAWAEPNQSIVVWDLHRRQEIQRIRGGAVGRLSVLRPDRPCARSEYLQPAPGQDPGPGVRKSRSDATPCRRGPRRGLERDGRHLATASGRRVFVWDLMGDAPPAELQGHRHGEVWVQFNHAGNLLASQGWDGYLRLWDPRSGELYVESHSVPSILFGADDGAWRVPRLAQTPASGGSHRDMNSASCEDIARTLLRSRSPLARKAICWCPPVSMACDCGHDKVS